MCRITSKWRPEILNEIEYLGFHNYNVFIYFYLKKMNLVVLNLCILKMFIIENYFEIIE